MKLPWFMHLHAGVNGLTGVLPTPCGSFVRSCADGIMEAAWYPMDIAFPGGASRECTRLIRVQATDLGEKQLEEAVVSFMHGHPLLALSVAFDGPTHEALSWERMDEGNVRSYRSKEGLFLSVEHDSTVVVDFLPNQGGKREAIATLSSACSEDVLNRRIDACVGRRLAESRQRKAA